MNLKEIIKKHGILILTFIAVLVAIGALFVNIHYSKKTNERAQEEFELRMRPYLIISKTKINDSEYTFNIKNEGLIPARITTKGVRFYEIMKKTDMNTFEAKFISEDIQEEYSLILGPSEKTSLKEIIPIDFKDKKMVIESWINYTTIIEEINKNWTSKMYQYHELGEKLEKKLPKMYMN